MVNRGCNHHCIFCANPIMTQLKMRSISVVLEELEQMLSCSNSHDSSSPHVLFVDDNLAVSIPQIRELCMGIKAMRRRCTWSGHVRADVDCETLNDMKEAGCTYLGIGAESGNQRVLDQLGKGITLQQLEKVVAHARSLDVVVKLSYMIGHFCDTPATMDDTIEHARRMNQIYGARVALSCNTLFPGTPQYNRREELGLTIHASSWDEYDINSPTISGKHFRLEDLHEKRFQFAQAIHA
jgi:anaerobic magnesium-protoporphyrin IX monomethyl ester cyclase